MFGLSYVIDRVGRMKNLDPISERLAGWVSQATAPDVIKNGLSGTWLGHQLHPLLTDIPIGAWTMASALDLTGRDEMQQAAQRLVGIGVLAAVPAAASGASDWSESYGKEQRIGLIHAIGNSTGTGLQIVSWAVRRSGRHRLGAGISLLGLAATTGASYLGGYLSFGMGVGVNHTAFQHPGRKWVDVIEDGAVAEGELVRVTANKVPVVLTRHEGQLRALSATCLHAGGPLDEGHIEDGCLVCPWHGSRFRLIDGTPARGPAAMTQPVWQVETADGRIHVKNVS